MEPEKVIGTALAVWGGKELVLKLLGPTADYLGGELKTYTEKGLNNLGRIFQNAARKLGDRLETPGQVPPRVLKGVLQEGYFCEDELSAEYFGGVLASSRTGVSRDDRGSTFLSLLGRLSTYQIRTHYIFYSILKRLYDGCGVNVGFERERQELQVYIPFDVYVGAMSFALGEEDFEVITVHVMNGLSKEELIGDVWIFGSTDLVSKHLGRKVRKGGIVFYPSAIGIELFLWAHGVADRGIRSFLDSATQFEALGRIEVPDGSEWGKGPA